MIRLAAVPTDLTPQDQAAIAALTGEIMHLVADWLGQPSSPKEQLAQSIDDLLTRRITEACQDYEAVTASEETHSTDSTFKHHISDCSFGYCGRHAGQRRAPDSALAEAGRGYREQLAGLQGDDTTSPRARYILEQHQATLPDTPFNRGRLAATADYIRAHEPEPEPYTLTLDGYRAALVCRTVWL